MTENNILYSKEGFDFVKMAKNNYSLSFQMENNNIILAKIIDFNLVKLIYDLNTDIYEKVCIQNINDNEAVANILMKHLFEDLGLPQRYSFLHITKIIGENNIKFISKTLKAERPEDIPIDAELMAINTLVCNCDIITQNKIAFSCNVLFEPTMIIPPIAEKLIGVILHKIFKRVKQFIENFRM